MRERSFCFPGLSLLQPILDRTRRRINLHHPIALMKRTRQRQPPPSSVLARLEHADAICHPDPSTASRDAEHHRCATIATWMQVRRSRLFASACGLPTPLLGCTSRSSRRCRPKELSSDERRHCCFCLPSFEGRIARMLSTLFSTVHRRLLQERSLNRAGAAYGHVHEMSSHMHDTLT